MKTAIARIYLTQNIQWRIQDFVEQDFFPNFPLSPNSQNPQRYVVLA